MCCKRPEYTGESLVGNNFASGIFSDEADFFSSCYKSIYATFISLISDSGQEIGGHILRRHIG